MPRKLNYRARATLTSKGQVTLPVVLRRLWDLDAGDEIDFTLQEDGRVVLRKHVRLTSGEISGDQNEIGYSKNASQQ